MSPASAILTGLSKTPSLVNVIMLTRIQRSAAVFIAGCIALSVVAISASPANAVGTVCPTGTAYHVWGHQYSAGSYYGQSGWLTTYNVSVPHPASAFSLSHLYTYYGNSNPASATTFVEVGYYKGLGDSSGTHNVTTPHYYWTMASPSTGYVEHDSSSGPTTGSSLAYEIEFVGHNYTLGTDDWDVYWDGFGSVNGVAHQPSMPHGSPLAGGEVQGDSSSWTQMDTHGTANQQIISSAYVWKNWTTAFTTSACNSSGITFTNSSNYMVYTATGQA